MSWISQLAFILIAGLFAWLITRRVLRIRSNILLGRNYDSAPDTSTRWRNMLLIAFGQKKMFKRWIPAFFHLLIYLGFVLINIEVLEIILDGVLGTHRIFAKALGSFYPVMISFFEILAVGVLIACIVFLFRRNVQRLPRLQQRELAGWPKLDANLILIIEILLMAAILSMNAADLVLQGRENEYPATGTFLISSLLSPWFQDLSTPALIAIERAAWWFHIIGIFAFAWYITYSKHLHIFISFPNTYYTRQQPKGQMNNMESVTNEVKIMLGLTPQGDGSPPPEGMRFGAKDVQDLSWKNLMDAYACTECGRCTSECPANITGKKLSPRKIMMDTRDRLEEVGQKKGEGKALLDDYITKEEIFACTSCNACVEACPVNINPLDIILQLRRYTAMEESSSPGSWNAMYSNIENNFAPWKFPASDRFKWAEEMKNKND